MQGLLARIDQHLADACSETARWQRLKRKALTRLGNGEHATGHYTAAVDAYRQALALTDADEDPLAWCDAAGRLVFALRRSASYAEAAALLQQIVARRTALQGPEQPDTWKAMSQQAHALFYQGKLTEAEALFRRVLQEQERHLGPDHPLKLMVVNNLAGLLQDKGDYAAAESLYRHCLEARKRLLGPDHVDTLTSVSNFAKCPTSRATLPRRNLSTSGRTPTWSARSRRRTTRGRT